MTMKVRLRRVKPDIARTSQNVYQWPETADEGGLLGYGPSVIEVFRRRARMVAGSYAVPSLPSCRSSGQVRSS